MSDYPVVECLSGDSYVIDDINHKLLKNGAVFDIARKRICGMSSDSKTLITRETASAMAKKRWKQGREASMAGIARLNSSESALEAWRDMCERVGDIVFDDEAQNRDKIAALKTIGQVTGLLASKVDYDARETKETRNVRIDIPPSAIAAILAFIEAGRQAQAQVRDKDDDDNVIDGEFVG